jgi:hypothetical protein
MKKNILISTIIAVIFITGNVQAQKVSTIYDVMGRPTTTVDEQGAMRNAQGQLAGTITAKGEYLDVKGVKVGSIEKGVMYDKDGTEVARMGEDGRVYDAAGKHIGTISEDGIVLNNHGIRLGTAPDVDKNIVALVFFFPKKPAK